MSEKKEKVPKLRFPGFSGEWEERRLSNLVTPIVREVPKPKEPYKKISIRSHAKGTFHQKVEDPDAVTMDKLFVVKENDLIVNITFAWEHAIAIATKEDDGLLVSHRFPTFIMSHSKPNFMKYIVTQENFRREMELISPGGAGRNRVLGKKDFLNLQVIAPIELEEQNTIGNFFANLDNLITLNLRELHHIKGLKDSLLQKMFPKEGEDTPELRFPGFTGSWKKQTLGSIVKMIGGATPSKANPDYWNGNIVWLSSQEIKNRYVSKGTYTITEKAVRESSTKVVPAFTPLIVSRSGILARMFPITLPTVDVAINQDIKALLFDKTNCQSKCNTSS